MRSSNNDKPAVRVVALRIHNVMGIVDAEIKPGSVTVIQGSNGLGKTSLLESFKAVLKGGHDATLLRKGAESGEIVMILSDGTEIQKRIRETDSKTQVTHPDFGKLPTPSKFIDALRDAFAINPLDFLTAKPDKRVELLLSAIPMELSPIDVKSIADLCTSKPDLSRHALQACSAIEKDLFDQRTGLNRAAKEKRASIAQMKAALPTEAGAADAAKVMASVELEYSDFRDAHSKATARITEQSGLNINSERAAAESAIAKLKDELMREMDALRDRYADMINGVREDSDKNITAIREKSEAKLLELNSGRSEKVRQFEAALATARANADAFTRAQTARDHIAHMESGALTLESDAAALTEALAELDNVRGNLLENLPIKGVTLVDGDIFVDGIPFDRVNESRRMRLAVEVAMLRSGNLPFMAVDGAEALDSKSLETLGQVAVEMGIQLVLSKVTDGPLEVSKIA